MFPHEEWNPQGLYSGIPYLTGHSQTHDASIVWVNAAETWVSLINSYRADTQESGRIAHFISESGVIDMFLLGSARWDSPKQISKKLATITGF